MYHITGEAVIWNSKMFEGTPRGERYTEITEADIRECQAVVRTAKSGFREDNGGEKVSN